MSQPVDITDEFFKSVELIDNNKVVQLPLFDLLEGTRAVEVNNPKLDTGLILNQLSDDEINFDCTQSISDEMLVGTMNKLMIMLMSWLDHSSLPVTVLSCRYVQEIVYKYTTNGDRGMDKFSLGDNSILASFVVGISKFVGAMITVGNTVLYEEEDITTRNMELNFLNEITLDEVVNDLSNTIKAVDNGQSPYKEIISQQLKLLLNLNYIFSILEYPTNLFGDNNTSQFSYIDNILHEGVLRVKEIIDKKHVVDSFEPPSGSFSRYAQASMSNRHIPGDLYDIGFDKAYTNLQQLYIELRDIFRKTNKISTLDELMLFLKYDIQASVNQLHVITRGIFQLFFVRDDQSILGSQFFLSDLNRELLNCTNVYNCCILSPKMWNLNTKDTEVVLVHIDKLFKDMEAGLYQNLTIFANNRCRQRQLINKYLIFYDSLQVQSENFEIELQNNFNIFDKLSDDSPALPISTYIYYTKLEMMIEFLLIGIELELYREFEISIIYWYVSYLIKTLIKLMQDRIFEFNKHKLNRLAKQKKKLKNKSEIDMKRDTLTKINQTIEQKIDYWTAFQKLTNSVVLLLNYYQNTGLLKPHEITSKFMANQEKLFNLRFKPFESIGVPAPLKYSQYTKTLVNDVTKDELISGFEAVKQELTEYSKSAKLAEKTWINSLIKTCFSYILELKSDPNKFISSIAYHPYFPKFTSKD